MGPEGWNSENSKLNVKPIFTGGVNIFITNSRVYTAQYREYS